MSHARQASTQTVFTRAHEVVPSNTVDLPFDARALYIGVSTSNSQSVRVITTGGDTAFFANVPQGSIIDVNVRRVLSTGTTASSIIALA